MVTATRTSPLPVHQQQSKGKYRSANKGTGSYFTVGTVRSLHSYFTRIRWLRQHGTISCSFCRYNIYRYGDSKTVLVRVYARDRMQARASRRRVRAAGRQHIRDSARRIAPSQPHPEQHASETERANRREALTKRKNIITAGRRPVCEAMIRTREPIYVVFEYTCLRPPSLRQDCRSLLCGLLLSLPLLQSSTVCVFTN